MPITFCKIKARIKMNKKNLKKYFIFFKKYHPYFFIVLIGITISLFFHLMVQQNFATYKNNSVNVINQQLKNTVDSLIIEIDELRDINDTPTVQKIIHDQITKQPVFQDQYMWINEVSNYEGGDNYATRFVYQNLPETEGQMLSTKTQDIKENFPYLEELEGVKTYGDIFYNYYSKNYTEDDISLKYTYAKLYPDYNWIICCGLSQTELLSVGDILYKTDKKILTYSSISIIIIILILSFGYYSITKTNTKLNTLKIAEAKSVAKTEFLSVLSHELRTPLNAIIGLNNLLQESRSNPQIVFDYSQKIDESSKILLDLINDVLDMSAIEKGKFKLEYRRFSIIELITPIQTIYKNLAEKKNLQFLVTKSEIQNDFVFGDSYRIRQIILNLLSNSLKFTQKGTLKLEISEKPLSKNQTNLTIIVSDTGCGMTPSYLSNLYKEFNQADTSIARKYGGSGLGLSITKKLVDLMHGQIAVESQINKGTSFTVKIPLEIYTDQKDTAKPIKQIFTFNEKEFKNYHILSVEDNALNQMITTTILQKYGIIVTPAENGQQALEIIKKDNSIQLILMDIRMPIMDGLTATRAIREFNTTIPIISLSANAFEEDIKEAYAAGMNFHLSKPISQDSLLQAIQNYI
jgi:signal transduction histidine kinase/CheY-like chemotaxis protein